MSLKEIAEFLDAPVDWPSHPEGEAANEQMVAWIKQTGMSSSSEELEYFRNSRFGEAVGASYPRARGEGLQFAVDWTGWAYFYDETFTPIIDQPAEVASRLEDLTEVLCAPPGTLQRPLRESQPGLADLMRRLQNVSPSWISRFQESMQYMFSGPLAKSLAATQESPITVEQCTLIRRADVGMHPPMDMIELWEGYEVPAIIHASPQMRTLRDLVADAIAIQNDIFSLSRDRARWDLNIVLILEQTSGLSTQLALEQARKMYLACINDFRAARGALLTLCQRIQLSTEDMRATEQYVEDLHTLFHGIFHAHVVAARFRADLSHAPDPRGPVFMHHHTTTNAPLTRLGRTLALT